MEQRDKNNGVDHREVLRRKAEEARAALRQDCEEEDACLNVSGKSKPKFAPPVKSQKHDVFGEKLQSSLGAFEVIAPLLQYKNRPVCGVTACPQTPSASSASSRQPSFPAITTDTGAGRSADSQQPSTSTTIAAKQQQRSGSADRGGGKRTSSSSAKYQQNQNRVEGGGDRHSSSSSSSTTTSQQHRNGGGGGGRSIDNHHHHHHKHDRYDRSDRGGGDRGDRSDRHDRRSDHRQQQQQQESKIAASSSANQSSSSKKIIDNRNQSTNNTIVNNATTTVAGGAERKRGEDHHHHPHPSTFNKIVPKIADRLSSISRNNEDTKTGDKEKVINRHDRDNTTKSEEDHRDRDRDHDRHRNRRRNHRRRSGSGDESDRDSLTKKSEITNNGEIRRRKDRSGSGSGSGSRSSGESSTTTTTTTKKKDYHKDRRDHDDHDHDRNRNRNRNRNQQPPALRIEAVAALRLGNQQKDDARELSSTPSIENMIKRITDIVEAPPLSGIPSVDYTSRTPFVYPAQQQQQECAAADPVMKVGTSSSSQNGDGGDSGKSPPEVDKSMIKKEDGDSAAKRKRANLIAAQNGGGEKRTTLEADLSMSESDGDEDSDDSSDDDDDEDNEEVETDKVDDRDHDHDRLEETAEEKIVVRGDEITPRKSEKCPGGSPKTTAPASTKIGQDPQSKFSWSISNLLKSITPSNNSANPNSSSSYCPISNSAIIPTTSSKIDPTTTIISSDKNAGIIGGGESKKSANNNSKVSKKEAVKNGGKTATSLERRVERQLFGDTDLEGGKGKEELKLSFKVKKNGQVRVNHQKESSRKNHHQKIPIAESESEDGEKNKRKKLKIASADNTNSVGGKENNKEGGGEKSMISNKSSSSSIPKFTTVDDIDMIDTTTTEGIVDNNSAPDAESILFRESTCRLSPLLSPIHEFPPLEYVNGKPTLLCQISLNLLDRIPKKQPIDRKGGKTEMIDDENKQSSTITNSANSTKSITKSQQQRAPEKKIPTNDDGNLDGGLYSNDLDNAPLSKRIGKDNSTTTEQQKGKKPISNQEKSISSISSSSNKKDQKTASASSSTSNRNADKQKAGAVIKNGCNNTVQKSSSPGEKSSWSSSANEKGTGTKRKAIPSTTAAAAERAEVEESGAPARKMPKLQQEQQIQRPPSSSSSSSALMSFAPSKCNLLELDCAKEQQYQTKAKDVKHEADSQTTEKTIKILMYLESVVYFIMTGLCMERKLSKRNKDSSTPHTMIKTTMELLKSVAQKYMSQMSSSSSLTEFVSKIDILSLRVQSMSYYKMFQMRQTQAISNYRQLNEFHKTDDRGSSMSLNSAPSSVPSNCGSSKSSIINTGGGGQCQSEIGGAGSGGGGGSAGAGGGGGSGVTPSPTPSPASSTGSSSHSLPPGLVAIPQQIESLYKQQLSHLHSLMWAHYYWQQAEMKLSQSLDDRAYFDHLNEVCGHLTLTSDLEQLCTYVLTGVTWLRHAYDKQRPAAAAVS